MSPKCVEARRKEIPVIDILDRLMSVWTEPLAGDDDAIHRFGTLYADPVRINERPTPLADLVGRARMLQTALTDVRYRILQRVDSSDRLAVAFVLSGRHVGPLETPAGSVAPTGRTIEIPTIDVLEFNDGFIDTVWVVSDQLGVLLQTGAIEGGPAGQL